MRPVQMPRHSIVDHPLGEAVVDLHAGDEEPVHEEGDHGVGHHLGVDVGAHLAPLDAPADGLEHPGPPGLHEALPEGDGQLGVAGQLGDQGGHDPAGVGRAEVVHEAPDEDQEVVAGRAGVGRRGALSRQALMASTTRADFDAQRRYTVALPTPARAATPSMVTPP